MFGVGLATAVAVDATIVRCTALPQSWSRERERGGCQGELDDAYSNWLSMSGSGQAREDIASDGRPRRFRPPTRRQPPADPRCCGTALGVVIAWALVVTPTGTLCPFDARTSIPR